jgi:hypothetical protein
VLLIGAGALFMREVISGSNGFISVRWRSRKALDGHGRRQPWIRLASK